MSITHELLKKSLDNKLNMAIYNLTFQDILKMKNDILEDVGYNSKIKSGIIEKLKTYRYIDDLNDLRDGAYIRWLSINPSHDTQSILNKGAIFCNVSISPEGVSLMCKSVSTNKYFLLKNIDQYIFFQKMSYQELLILQAIDVIKYKNG